MMPALPGENPCEPLDNGVPRDVANANLLEKKWDCLRSRGMLGPHACSDMEPEQGRVRESPESNL